MRLFVNRQDAGRQLAARLQHLTARPQTMVVALPRGGVPVAAEIAQALSLPLDVLVVRKLGAPGQPELAIGAIAQVAGQTDTIVMNPEVEKYFADQPPVIAAIKKREQRELQRREQVYRGVRAPLNVDKHIVIVVDDGAATGATMRAAVQALRLQKAERIIAALPVCSREAQRMLLPEAHEFVCIDIPPTFYAVGEWYDDFDQTTDEEVRRLLEQSDRQGDKRREAMRTNNL